MKRLLKFLKDEEGVLAMEYALLAGLIAIVILVAVTNVGTALSTFFQTHIAESVAAW